MQESLRDILSSTIEEECKKVDKVLAQKAIRAFLREQSADRAQYIAQLLDVTFSFYSLFTDEATQSYLRKAIPKITMFLDTNFLFGILNLHNNPQNEMSLELVAIVNDQELPFDLYYHEDSLLEMQATINRTAERISRRTWPSGLSNAVLKTRKKDLTGIEIKFHEANSERQIAPQTFFLTYRHLERLLKSKGFKIYRRPDASLHTKLDEETADLISKYNKFLDDHNFEKPFKTVKHDVVIWMATNALRKASASGLDVGALLLSADQRLFAFDWGVLSHGGSLGVVVLPSQLLQLLRPFIPRTADFDKKFADVFALPEFRSNQSDFSKVTGRVLDFLATVKDINEETAVAILADELLLARLKNVEPEEEIKQIIESEILKKNSILENEVKNSQENLRKTEGVITEKQALLEAAQKDAADKERLILQGASQLDREKAEKEAAIILAQEEKLSAERANVQLTTTEAEKRELAHTVQTNKVILEDLLGRLSAFEKSRNRKAKILRVIFGVLFAIAGFAFLFFSPWVNNCLWFQGHAHVVSLYLAASVMICGLSWAIFAWKYKIWAWVTIIVGVVMKLIGVL